MGIIWIVICIITGMIIGELVSPDNVLAGVCISTYLMAAVGLAKLYQKE